MEKNKKTTVSVIIPTYNEADSIQLVLKELVKLFDVLHDLEIIIVDSASVDGTPEVVGEFIKDYPNIRLIALPHVTGYGAAFLEGVKCAKGDFIVVFDGAGDFDAMDIPKVVQLASREQADVVIGSRYLGEIRPASLSFWHKLGNALLSLLFRLIFGKKITDVQSNFLSLSKTALAKLSLHALDFPISIRLLSKAVKEGLKISEVPVTYRPRFVKYSKSDIWKTFRAFLVSD